MFTFDENIFSDLFKDAYGFRPRNHEFYTASDEAKQKIWDETCDALEASMKAEELRKQESIAAFKEIIQKYIDLGAGDEETALRWMTQTEGFRDTQDIEHFAWKADILFTDFGKSIVNKLKEMYFD